MPGYVERYLHGDIQLAPLITRTLALVDINQALADLRAARGIKSIVVY
ncbi:hypothetical protein [Xanthomonas euvesicatoria]